ncbi:MAG: type II secretion system protein [Sphingobacteriales bacterium]|nr:MAG: type II secretion system protein [Sphingobacteriales bacterium]
MRPRGFTLIELLVVISIVAVLATIALPLAEMAQKRSQEEELRHSLRQIRSAIDAYKLMGDQGRLSRQVGDTGYPADLNVLVDGVVDAQSPKAEKVYLLRILPRDPFAPTTITSAAETWAPRSYASPPTDPQPGRDIFDVHSKSKEVGLNGVPYSRW